MHLRKSRQHETGLSNKDYRIPFHDRDSQRFYNTDTKMKIPQIDLLAAPKLNNFSSVIESKIKKTIPNPLQTTKASYLKSQRQIKNHAGISNLRSCTLEEKKVFVGESNTLYSEIPDERQTIDKTLRNSKKKNLNDLKHTININTQVETQLVGMQDYQTKSLDGVVDIQKVKEIRKALRRKYANRTNIQKIFKHWDQDNTGQVNLKRMIEMCSKLQIPINIDEAQVLMASVDTNQNGYMSLDEFIQLIFQDNNALDIDLSKMRDLKIDDNIQGDYQQILEQVHRDQLAAQKDRHENQLSFILKNKLNQIQHNLQLNDDSKTGAINFQLFTDSIRKSGLTRDRISEKDIQAIFDKHRLDTYNMDYNQFLKQLNDFQFVLGETYERSKIKQKSTNLSQIEQQNEQNLENFNKFENIKKDIILIDLEKQPISKLQSMHKNAMKVSQQLQYYFPKEQDFNKYLMDQLNLDENSFALSQVHNKKLTKVMRNFFFNVNEEFSDQELQSFFSIFKYNTKGNTNLKDLSKQLYNETCDDYVVRAGYKNHGPYPEVINEEAEDNQSNIQRVLEKVDQKVFCGSRKMLDIYNDFDVDKDGYVSRQDVKKKMDQLNILDKYETNALLKYLDPENKGFLDIKEFNQKIRANMSNVDRFNHLSQSQACLPNEDYIQDLKHALPNIRKTVEASKNSWKPVEALLPKTRFGATPAHKETFSNFQPAPNTGMFMSSIQQFSKDHLKNVDFQIADKIKRQSLQESKYNYLQNNSKSIENRNEQKYQNDIQRDQNCLKTKALITWTYEHRCHLQNKYK